MSSRSDSTSTPPTRPFPFHLLLFPLLALLHLLFTLSSLVLRLLQSLSFTPGSSPSRASLFEPPATLNNPPPKHLAVALALPRPPNRRAWTEGETDVALDNKVVKSVRRAVSWAAEWGVVEISIWDNGSGHVLRLQRQITEGLLDLPPSPPSSGPSTPPQQEAPLASPAPLFTNKTLTLAPLTAHGRRHIKVHLLAPGAKDAIGASVRSLHSRHVQPVDIDQSLLDSEIRRTLSIQNDPELLIIHPLSPPSGWRALLPRPAPELHGYPFWLLRVSEIYAHPTSFPLRLDFLSSLLRASRLPILRKLGFIIPQDADIDSSTDSKHADATRTKDGGLSSGVAGGNGAVGGSGSTGGGRRRHGRRNGAMSADKTVEDGEKGVLSLQAWWGAQAAWERVEQRLGR